MEGFGRSGYKESTGLGWTGGAALTAAPPGGLLPAGQDHQDPGAIPWLWHIEPCFILCAEREREEGSRLRGRGGRMGVKHSLNAPTTGRVHTLHAGFSSWISTSGPTA